MNFVCVGNNHIEVRLAGGATLVYSYETLVGLRCDSGDYKRQNVWGPTTGKHMNRSGLQAAKQVMPEELENFAALAVGKAAEVWKARHEKHNNA